MHKRNDPVFEMMLAEYRFKLIFLLATFGWAALLGQVPVSVPTIAASPGSDLKIPVVVGDLTGKDVTSFEFVISCDTALVKFSGIHQEGTLSGGLTMFANNRVKPYGPGKMKVVCASAQPLSGKGILVYLTGSAQKLPGVCSLQLSNVILNTGSPPPAITNGSVKVLAAQKSIKAAIRDSIPAVK